MYGCLTMLLGGVFTQDDRKYPVSSPEFQERLLQKYKGFLSEPQKTYGPYRMYHTILGTTKLTKKLIASQTQPVYGLASLGSCNRIAHKLPRLSQGLEQFMSQTC